MTSTLITGASLLDPAKGKELAADLLIRDGKIAAVGKKLKADGAVVIDAKGMLVTPGLLDMHVHLREPGREDKETIETGLKAALAGGVTGVLSMPNTNPEVDNQTVVEFQLSRARKLDLGRLYVAGKTTKNGQKIAEMWELKQTGAVAVTDDGHDVDDACLLLHALEWAKTFDIPLITHAENASLSHGGVMHEGKISQLLGLNGQPRSAEILAIQKSIALAEEVGAQLHIAHISTAGGIEAVRQARKRGVRVTAEATPHHFALIDEECLGWNTNAKMHPPLREKSDREAVREGLADGTLSVIATDHAPHLISEKLLPFQLAPVGTVGLETLFGAVNTYLVQPGILTMAEALRRMTVGPAAVLHLAAPSLAAGAVADISIFDIKKEWTVDPATFYSKGRNSVFAGKKLTGKAVHVFVGGAQKLSDGRIL